MMILRKFATVVLLLVFLFIAPSMADIISLNLRSDHRQEIRFSEFGFSHTGQVSIEISNVSVTSTLSSQPDPSRIGFFLLSHELLSTYLWERKRKPNLCVLDINFITVLFTFQDLYPHSEFSFNRSYPVSSPGVHLLDFANCNPQSLVTMDVRTELYNTDEGNTKDYLSAVLTPLLSLYFIFSVLYLCFLGFWISVCFKNQRCFHFIHLLMGVLLVITFLHFICAKADQDYLKVTGTRHGWTVLFYICRFIKNVLLYTVIELIGMGWCLWKQFLQGKEKLVLMIVILLQVLANVYSILVGVTGPYNEDRLIWSDDFIGIDFLCCFVIFVPFFWSITLLRKTCETDGNAAINLVKLQSLAVMLFVYVLFTRFIVETLATFVVFTAPWMINAAEETVSLVFCMGMFYMFRPFVDDEKAAGIWVHGE